MSKVIRDGFIFYRSFYDAIRELPRDIQGEVLTAIMEYGLNGVTTENLKPIARAVVSLIKPQIDANNKRFENGKKGAEHGKKGGNPNFKKGGSNPYYNPEDNPKITPKEKDKVKEKEYIDSLLELRKKDFSATLTPFLGKYGKDVLNDFYQYWTEPNKSKTKFRQELEKTWDLKRRLGTWIKNDFNKHKSQGFAKSAAVDQSENKNFFQ